MCNFEWRMDLKSIRNENYNWNILQDPLLLKVFKELSKNDVLTCREVCLNWNRIAQDDLLWKYLFERDFLCQKSSQKSDRKQSPSIPLNTSWKYEYERLVDRVPRKNIQVLKGHSDEVVHIAYSNDGSEFVSCSKDQSFIVWKKETKDLSTKFNSHYKQDMSVYDWLVLCSNILSSIYSIRHKNSCFGSVQ